MTKRLRNLYIFYWACFAVEILVVILCLVSLLFGAASSLEWIFLLFTTVVEIPSSVYSLRKIHENRVNVTDTVNQTDETKLRNKNLGDDSLS